VGERFPWGTLLVNGLGCFLLGGWIGAEQAAGGLGGGWLPFEDAHAFAVVGFCGGLTTFSTVSLQSFSLVAEQAWSRAGANLIGSVLVCLLSVATGYALGEAWVS
jgi:CrcB protein